MPSPVAQTSKQTARQELARRTGGLLRGTTTAAGDTLTAVDSGNAGEGDGRYDDQFIVLGGGTYTGHYRKLSKASPDPAYISSSGTYTWRRALAGASGSGVAYDVYPFDPTFYTSALRQAAAKVQLRPVTWHFTTHDDSRQVFSLPDPVQKVRRLTVDTHATEEVDEDFASLSGWTNVSGSGQVSSGRFSFVAVTNANLVVQSSDPLLPDGYVEFLSSGDVDADYDILGGVFRYINSTNFLVVRFTDADKIGVYREGTGTAISDASFTTVSGTQYKTAVRFVGSHIEVWVNDVQRLDFNLTAADAKYLAGTNVGIYEAVSGSPNTLASLDDFRAHSISNELGVSQWAYEKPTLSLESYYGDNRLLHVDGLAPFSQPAIDTTDGQLTSDTTAVLECAVDSNDISWELLMNYAVAFLYRIAAFPGNMPSEQERQKYKSQAADAFEFAERQYSVYALQKVKTTLRGYRY